MHHQCKTKLITKQNGKVYATKQPNQFHRINFIQMTNNTRASIAWSTNVTKINGVVLSLTA